MYGGQHLLHTIYISVASHELIDNLALFTTYLQSNLLMWSPGITCLKQPPLLGPLTQNTVQMNLY